MWHEFPTFTLAFYRIRLAFRYILNEIQRWKRFTIPRRALKPTHELRSAHLSKLAPDLLWVARPLKPTVRNAHVCDLTSLGTSGGGLDKPKKTFEATVGVQVPLHFRPTAGAAASVPPAARAGRGCCRGSIVPTLTRSFARDLWQPEAEPFLFKSYIYGFIYG